MRHAALADMTGGWIVGDFEPSIARVSEFEFGIKHYAAGTVDQRHFHKIATEVTVIVSGEAVMAGRTWKAGDIVLIEVGEEVEFSAVTDVTIAVVKFPSAPRDKYIV